MIRFIKGALFGAALGFGVWHFGYPAAPDGWQWVFFGGLLFGFLNTWLGHIVLKAFLDWWWHCWL